MNDKLSLIREKCIAANPDKNWREMAVGEFGVYKSDTPCRLADVLLATRGEDEQGFRVRISASEPIICKRWNLRADRLEDQSEKTINFLYELLK